MKKLIFLLFLLWSCSDNSTSPKTEIDSLPKLEIWLATPCDLYLDINGFYHVVDASKFIYNEPSIFNLLVGKNQVIYISHEQIDTMYYEMKYWDVVGRIYSCY